MNKKNLVDADGVKSIGVIASECKVPERWLRNKVAAGEIESRRVGYNVFVPITEIEKIKQLAVKRGRARG